MGTLFTLRGQMGNEQVSQAPGWEAGKPAQSCPVSGGQSTRPIPTTSGVTTARVEEPQW